MCGWFFEELYILFPIANLSKIYFPKTVFSRFFLAFCKFNIKTKRGSPFTRKGYLVLSIILKKNFTNSQKPAPNLPANPPRLPRRC